MDMLYSALIVSLTTSLTLLLIYINLKKTLQNMLFDSIPDLMDGAKEYIEEWINTEKAQKALWQLGGLIGNGAIAGAGIQKRSGKKGIEGLILELIGSFMQNKINPATQTQQQPQPQTGLGSV